MAYSEYDDEFEASLRRLDEQQFREQQAVSQELARPFVDHNLITFLQRS